MIFFCRLSPLVVFFCCCCSPQNSPLFPPASYLALQSLNTLALPFFFSFLTDLLFYFSSTSLRPVSVVPSRALLRQIKCPIHLVSSPLHRAGERALSSPLLSSVSADSHLSTPSPDEQIRSKLGQVTQWWMNGRWPWLRIYRAS